MGVHDCIGLRCEAIARFSEVRERIIAEEELLPRIRTVIKLLACYGITDDSVGR